MMVKNTKTTRKDISLYTKGSFIGYTRSLANQKTGQHLLKLDGVNDIKETNFYLGKKVVYVYKTKNTKGKNFRAIWGKVTRSHGNNGVVRAVFKTNLPGQALGKPVRVMLYPSSI